MKTNNLIVVLATVAIVIALANISVTLFKVSQLTGYATGFVNITIIQLASLNVTNDTLSWGHGMVASGQSNATLYTVQDGAAQVSNGNWSATGVAALRVENIGNVNLTLTLQNSLDAYGFFGSRAGTAAASPGNSNEEYFLNITNALANSCNNNVTGINTSLNEWVYANKTGMIVCSDFNYEANANAVYIDASLTVPSDAINVSTGGGDYDPVADTITITGTSNG